VTETWGPETESWFRRRTIRAAPPFPETVAELKEDSGLSVTVCLPALDEAQTVGGICESIRSELMDRITVVDELVVMDSGSTDATAEVAAAAGATVHRVADVLPDLPPSPGAGGKGEAMWKTLSVVTGDLVLWLDADIRDFSTHFITSLVHPLLTDDELVMTKAFYERPLDSSNGYVPQEGARVTELTARPLLQLLHPRLSGFIQPLAGEVAARRAKLLEIPFVTGYGVDVALLIDVAHRFGLDSIAQVDLGTRRHRNRDLFTLGRTAFQVAQAIFLRAHEAGEMNLPARLPIKMVQFLPDNPGAPQWSDLGVTVRPPMNSVLTGA
jgi:glucosyl-3-phosphoglycerate synthase